MSFLQARIFTFTNFAARPSVSGPWKAGGKRSWPKKKDLCDVLLCDGFGHFPGWVTGDNVWLALRDSNFLSCGVF